MPKHFAEADDLAACRALLRDGSRSFFFASLVLPRHVRDPASALYAFCRLADDAIDRDGGRDAALRRLSERLAHAYAGTPQAHPVDRAFAATVQRHAIPRALPEALIEGLAWDAEGRSYETIEDLHAYAARVAGSVGGMMAVLMGASDPAVLARACDLGVAMQLSNIARDVGEDARMGRLYLPRAWMREAGLDPDAWLAEPHFSPALGRVVQRLLDDAEALYVRAEAGIAVLPADCRPGIMAARRIYAAIGHAVRDAGGNSIGTRAVVPGARKLGLLAASLVPPRPHAGHLAAPALGATQFLVAAVAATPAAAPRAPAWWDLDARVAIFFGMMARLERQDFMARHGGRAGP
jgi:phytoene synthase